MADSDNTQPAKPKRRLKAPAETVRERQASAQVTANKSRGRSSRFWSAAGRPFRAFAGLGIWQTKAWKPFKVVGKAIGHIVAPPYVRNSFRELKLVTWPNWRLSWRLTFAVLSFSVVFGLFIAGVDFALDKLFKEVLLK